MQNCRLPMCSLVLSVAFFCSGPAFAQCTVPNVIANGQVADASKVMDNFTAVAGCADAGVKPTGTPQAGSIAVFSGSQTVTGGNLTGDVTTSGGTATTLSNTGVTAGTYTSANVTIDSKGRITSASSGAGGGGGGGLVYLGSVTASNSAALDLINMVSPTYDIYTIELVDFVLDNSSTKIGIVFSSDNGSTWDTSAKYDSAMLFTNESNYSASIGTRFGTYGYVVHDFLNSPGNAFNGSIKLFNPLGSKIKVMTFQGNALLIDNHFYNTSGSIRYNSTSVINAIRIISSNGNITSGIVRVYGLSR
jgi:hypothetical protein